VKMILTIWMALTAQLRIESRLIAQSFGIKRTAALQSIFRHLSLTSQK